LEALLIVLVLGGAAAGRRFLNAPATSSVTATSRPRDERSPAAPPAAQMAARVHSAAQQETGLNGLGEEQSVT
jgi:hypothetical protein